MSTSDPREDDRPRGDGPQSGPPQEDLRDEGSYGPRRGADPSTASDAGLTGGSGATAGEGTQRPGTIPADREAEHEEDGER